MRHLTFYTFFICCLNSLAQTPSVLWSSFYLYGDIGNRINGMVCDTQHNIYISGYYMSDNYPYSWIRGSFINKLDPPGNPVWADTVVELGNSINVIALSEDNIYTIGSSFTKRNFNGDTIWKKNIFGQGIAYFKNALYTGSGNRLCKYDLNGNMLWNDSVSIYGPVDVKTSPNYIYALGGDGPWYNPLILYQYDSLGNRVWSRPPGVNAWAITTDSADNIYVVGTNEVNKINSSGVLVWTITKSFADSGSFYNATISGDTIYICGTGSDGGVAKSRISIYSAQTAAFFQSHFIDFFPGYPEQANFILKDDNAIYLAGHGGYQMNTLYLAKVDLDNVATSTGSSMMAIEETLKTYPNPNDGNFNVAFNSLEVSDYTLEIHNTLGQIVYTEKLNMFSGKYTKKLSVVEYGKGVYTITLTNSNNETVKKIIVY